MGCRLIIHNMLSYQLLLLQRLQAVMTLTFSIQSNYQEGKMCVLKRQLHWDQDQGTYILKSTPNDSDLRESFMAIFIYCYGVLFSTKKCIQKAILRLFLKKISPSKRMVCFILNNLHFPMVEGIVLYALYKSRVLIIPYKTDDFTR